MASRDYCAICGQRIGLSEPTMQNDATGQLAHSACVMTKGFSASAEPRAVRLPGSPPPEDPMKLLAELVAWFGDDETPDGEHEAAIAAIVLRAIAILP